MKAPIIIVISLAAFFMGAFFGIWVSQQRLDKKVSELNARHDLDWAGQAFLLASEWQSGHTNFVHNDLVYKMEYGMVATASFVEAHPQSDVAKVYYEIMENIAQCTWQYRTYLRMTNFQWHCADTNWDRDFEKVLARYYIKETNR